MEEAITLSPPPVVNCELRFFDFRQIVTARRRSRSKNDKKLPHQL